MHETGLIRALLEEVERLRAEQDTGARVIRVRIQVGEAIGSSEEHMREHFQLAAAGTRAEGAEIEIVSRPGGDLVLESVEIEI